jgi:hypothetical protein
MFENVQFFRICILRFQKVLLLKNINMGIKKRRCLCWFQIRCCRLKQMPIKKLEPKKLCEVWVPIFVFVHFFVVFCIWFVRLNDFWDDFVQPKSLSAIFQSPEDDLPESGRFRLTTSRNRQAPVSHLTASTNRGRWLTGAGRFRLVVGRFRLVVSRNRPGPGKSSSGILGLERMRWLSFVIAESDFGWTKPS